MCKDDIAILLVITLASIFLGFLLGIQANQYTLIRDCDVAKQFRHGDSVYLCEKKK